MLAGPGLKGRIAQRQYAAFARSNRSMSSLRSPMSRFAVSNGRILGGKTAWKASGPSIALPAVRFNSTSTSTSTPPLTDGQITPELTPDISDVSLADFPERIGYLKDIGLDFGWGPSAMAEFMIEHIHIWSGLPWLGSIVAAGILFRAAMLPMFMRASDTSARLQNNQHILTPLRQKMMMAAQAGKQMESQVIRAEMSKKNAELGIKPSRVFLPMLVQVPIGFGCYRVISNMASLPVPALAEEKYAWLTDLTVADPTYALPLLASTVLYLSLRKGGEVGAAQPNMESIRKAINYGMPVISFMFVMSFPAALQVYFLTTGIFGLAQAYMLNSHAFRRSIGVEIARKPDPAKLSGGGDAPDNGRALRMITEQIEQERAKIAESHKAAGAPAGTEQQLSFIDRALNNIKETKSNISKEASAKIQEMSGKGQKKNPDGTVVEQRLSDKDRKLAEDYEKRRREEEEWKREERNHARRQAYLRELEREREKAKSAFKNPKIRQ
ncbi:60Kd inner membrane protein-domain-containing protein [Aspergillus unguis]